MKVKSLFIYLTFLSLTIITQVQSTPKWFLEALIKDAKKNAFLSKVKELTKNKKRKWRAQSNAKDSLCLIGLTSLKFNAKSEKKRICSTFEKREIEV